MEDNFVKQGYHLSLINEHLKKVDLLNRNPQTQANIYDELFSKIVNGF